MGDIKWYSEFSDIDAIVSGVEIIDRDFTGVKTKVLSGGNPFNLEMVSFTDPFTSLRPLKADVQWISQTGVNFSINQLFITDDRRYQVRFYRYDITRTTKEYLFYGYMVFADCEEPFAAKPYPVAFSATCGLPFLKEDFFVDAAGVYVDGKISLIKIIANCLASTGQTLDIHTYVNLFEEGIPYGVESALAKAGIDADGLRGMKSDEVLSGVLGALNAFIVQSKGVWVIKSLKDQIGYFGINRKFNSNGDSIGSAEVRQTASFGKTPLNASTPNVVPMATAFERLAKPNSIVTNNVKPGIPVNRLPNGSFSGPLVGGKIPGWKSQNGKLLHPSGGGWTRSGFGRPDDPYKVDITGRNHILDANNRTYITLENEIVIRGASFATNPQPKTKLRISGAFRAQDFDMWFMFIRVNKQRDYVSYLVEGGKWVKSKKLEGNWDGGALKMIPDVRTELGGGHDFAKTPLQTFDVLSEPIENWLKIGEDAVAKVDVLIYAGTSYSENYFNTSNPRLTWEDFSLTVETGIPFEGDHAYAIDAKFPIRNPIKSEYTSIIADKIGIEHPEQGLPANRVMTGYMTRPNGVLTTGWARYPEGFLDPQDSTFEPLQKKSLRERVRLVCGKRREMEGKFIGYGLFPDHSIFSRYENPSAPNKFWTVTGWRWDVKNRQYALKFFELDFSPLANETIDLVGETSASRGNRQYSGGGGTATGNSGAGSETKTTEQIVIDDVPPFPFVAGVDPGPQMLDVGPLIQSSHLPQSLEAFVLTFPSWVTGVSFYRGEDLADPDKPVGGMLHVLWEGIPTEPGNYQILIELVGPEGEDVNLIIPIIVYEAPKIKYSLIDTDQISIVGPLPGAYKLPAKWDARAVVTGFHKGYLIKIVDPDGTVLVNDEEDKGGVESGSYRAFQITDGIVSGPGLYNMVFQLYNLGIWTVMDNFYFTLYDDEFLAKVKLELWNESKIGDISIQDDSKFKKPVWFTPRVYVSDLPHDETILTLYLDGVLIQTTAYYDAQDFYDVYEIAQSDQQPGNYRINVVMFDSGAKVMERQHDFVILDKDPVAEGGLIVGTMIASTANFQPLQTLPLKGTLIDLPEKGTNIKLELSGLQFDYISWQNFEEVSKQYVEFNSFNISKRENYIEYKEIQTEAEVFAYWDLSSIDIGKHYAPSNFRFKFIARLGGANGKIVAIRQGDVAFRVPLLPEDYSGLRFLNVQPATPDLLIDPNMPKTGGKYSIPAFDALWTVSFRKLASGLEFDQVIIKLKKGGVTLRNPLYPGAVVDFHTTPTTDLASDQKAYVFGTLNGSHRELYDPGSVARNIDEPGLYTVTAEVYRFGTLLQKLETEFTLELESEIPEVPESDCCSVMEWFIVKW